MELKEFINNHREEFEEEFPPNLWGKINARIPKEKRKSIWLNSKILRIAAGVLICLSVGFWFGKYYRNDNSLCIGCLSKSDHIGMIMDVCVFHKFRSLRF